MIFTENKISDAVTFSIGAAGYSMLEIVWRGHTHWSMALAGGICLVGLKKIPGLMPKKNLISKAAAGSMLITSVEFLFGLVFNVLLKKEVWDYSNMPFNIDGQICLLYSFLWMLLCIAIIPLIEKINKADIKGDFIGLFKKNLGGN